MELAPVLVQVYDRIEHLKRCVNSLLKNKDASETVLYIVSDAASKQGDIIKIEQVRNYILSIQGFKKVVPLFLRENKGSLLSAQVAVTLIFQEYNSFIFLEDDIVVSCDFLDYVNRGLKYYEKDKRIFSVCGFKGAFELPVEYPNEVYFYPCLSPWGFATWKDRWEAVNYDYFDRYSELKKDKRKYKEFTSIGFYIKGILQADSKKEIVAGDLRIYYHMFRHGMCSVFPVVSKTQNWGFDGTGEHCGNKKAWWAKPELDTRNRPTKFIPFTGYDKELLRNHRKFQDKINGGIIAKYLKYTWVHRLWKKMKRYL